MLHRRKTSLQTAAVVSLISLLAPVGAGAQERQFAPAPTGPLTLEQVLQLAEPRSESLSIAIAGVRRAEADELRARSGLKPQLSASASYDRALASEFDGVFDTTSSGPGCAPFSLNPQAPLDARVTELERAIDCGAVGGGGFFGSGSSDGGDLSDLPFGRKNTWRANLAFTQNLYSGGRNGAQMALATAGHQSAELGVTTTRAEFLFEVTRAYYDALLSEQLVTIAAATLEQAAATLKQTQAGFDAGTQPEFEVLRARVSRDNQLPVLIRQRVDRDVAHLRLKRLLDIAPDVELRLADSLGDETLAPSPLFAERVAAVEKTLQSSELATLGPDALPERTLVAQAGATVSLREASLRLTEAEKMPSVALNSTYSRIAYPEGAFPTFDRSNWSVGVSVNVPILTGGRQKGDELVARAELDQAQLQRQQASELADLDTRATLATLLAARAAWDATAGTVQQADRAYQIADVRFGAGVSTQLELNDARLARQQAEANRAQAARDLQVARARVALLRDLPLANGAEAPSVVPVVPQQLPAPTQPLSPGGFRNASVQGSPAQAGTR